MKKTLLSLFAALFITATGFSQINIPLNGLAKENFNGIGSTATAALPAGWKMSSAGTGFTSGYATGTNVTATTQAANSGTPTTGGRYNWATSGNTDRAIGFMSDGAYADGNAVFADYLNTTGATITNITVSYNAERYRTNTGTASVALFSSTNGSTWTAVPGGDISAAVFAPGASAYSFVTPQTVYKTATITGLNITTGTGHFYLRWVFTTGGTVSQGLGLDDVTVFAQTGTPVVTGSLRDNIQVDNNTPGQAEPGDQIRYTMVIRNTGTADANGVTLANQTPTYTTLNPGSVKTSSLARDDSYSTSLNIPLGFGPTVLSNDMGVPLPNAVTFFGAVSNATTVADGTNTAKSDNGGTVLMKADGTFTYTPVTGFNGIDRFAYIATNGNAPDNMGFVTITVGSAAITPGAAESYNVAGNISITTPGSGTGNLLNNDGGTGILIGSVNGNVASVGVPVTTANGGTLTVNSNGSFTYNPAPGYEGADNFTYTIDNGFSSPSAAITVNLTVAGMVWFIDNNYAGAVADGRLGTPFKTLAAFQAVNNGTGNNPAAGDNIFLYSSVTDYAGGITLLSNQKLIGAGATATLAVITGITLPSFSSAYPATSQTPPVIVNAAGDGVTLNNLSTGNTLRGFDVHNCSSIAIKGTDFGTLTVSEVSVNTTKQALSLGLGGPSGGIINGNFPLITSTGGVSNMAFNKCGGTFTITSGNCSGSTFTAVMITGGTLNLTTGQSIAQASNNDLLYIGGHSIGNITFQTGTLSATNGTGLSFDDADGIYNFTGTTTLNGGNAGIDIISGSGGTFNFGSGTVITNPSGDAFTIGGSSNTATVTYSGNITKNNSGSLVSISNHTGNTVTFQTGTLSATTASAGNGIFFNDADATYNFNGTTTLSSGTAAVNITNGSGGTFSFGTGTTITSPGAAAFSIVGGTAAVTYSGNITQASAFPAVSVTGGHITGTVTFQTGTINATNSTGLRFDNADGTYNFNGNFSMVVGTAITLQNGCDGTFDFGTGTSYSSNTSAVPALVIGGTSNMANLTYRGNITNNDGSGTLISITNHTGGTVTFQTGTISSQGFVSRTAANLQFDNADGTYNFNGTTTLSGGGAGINIRTGSAGNFTFGTNTTITCANNAVNPDTTFSLIGGTATVTYSGAITQDNIFPAVAISGGHITGTVTFQTGAISSTGITAGSGLQFDNADGNYLFNGLVTLDGTGGGDAGIDIVNGSDGSFTFLNAPITKPSGAAFVVTGGNGIIAHTGIITKNNGGRLIDIQSRTGGSVTINSNLSSTSSSTGINVSSCSGGTVTFNGSTKTISTGTNTGVNLATNTGATINFPNGGLAITTSTGAGFNATGGGTVSVSGSNNTVTSGAGIAINVNATTISNTNMTFLSVNVNGASKGITLNNTGAVGGLIVTGTGTTAGSGGTIQNISARGVEFISSNNISLKNMNFVNANTVDAVVSNTGLSTGNNLSENAVIYLSTVNTITLDRINISGTSVEEGINGNAVTNFNLTNSSLINVGNGPDEDGLHFYNMLGTNNITSTTITSSGDDNVNIQNASGTSTINITGGSFNTGVLGSGLLFGPRVTTNTTINISGVTCNNNFSGGIVSDCSDAATMVINVSTSTSTNNNDGISISSASGNCQFDLNGNTINNNDFGPINVLKAAFSVGGLFEGRVRNNIIIVENGKAADGMSLQNLGGGTLKMAVTGNNINYSGTQRGIYIAGGQDGNAFIEGTVTGNSMDVKLDGVGNAVNGILAQVAVASPSGDPSNMCMDIGGAGALKNTFTHTLGGTLAGGDVRVRQRFVSVVRLPGYAGGGTDATAAGLYLDGRNTVVSPSTVSIATSISGGAVCAQPSN